MENNLKISILRTLCYADIFDFPMKEEEIWKFLIRDNNSEDNSDEAPSSLRSRYLLRLPARQVRSHHREQNPACRRQSLWRRSTEAEISSHSSTGLRPRFSAKADNSFNNIFTEKLNGYFSLKDRGSIVKKREERLIASRRKIKKAEKAALLLSRIPSIRFIGVTGSLAICNAKKDDDIDLLIITSRNTLWITRFFASFILFQKKLKRRRNVRSAKDAICLNMFLSEGDLKIKERNLFTAHEIDQIKPLLNKTKTFEKFIFSNKWVIKFLPNAIFPQKVKKVGKSFLSRFLFPLELVFYLLQRFYMMRHITIERISVTRAMFHPVNRSEKVIRAYERIFRFYLGAYMKGMLKDRKVTFKQPPN